jgi:hypothetical protein
MATIKKPVKKAQAGVKVDNTSVKKVNATKNMKGDNEIAVRVEKNKVKTANYYKNMDASAALMYGDKEGSLSKDFLKQDSISKDSTKKATALKNNPKFKLKSGGSIAKDGKWMQKAAASIKRRGTEGKCTPITKPGCTGKAKALAKTFKKIAKSNKKK